MRLVSRRAYKLGKKRWSYNQCELKIVQEGGDQRLDVVEAVQVSTLLISKCSRPSFPPLSMLMRWHLLFLNGEIEAVHVCAALMAMLHEQRHLNFSLFEWQD